MINSTKRKKENFKFNERWDERTAFFLVKKEINKITSLTSVTFCGTVCVTKGGDTDGEVHIGRDYVW